MNMNVAKKLNRLTPIYVNLKMKKDIYNDNDKLLRSFKDDIKFYGDALKVLKNDHNKDDIIIEAITYYLDGLQDLIETIKEYPEDKEGYIEGFLENEYQDFLDDISKAFNSLVNVINNYK